MAVTVRVVPPWRHDQSRCRMPCDPASASAATTERRVFRRGLWAGCGYRIDLEIMSTQPSRAHRTLTPGCEIRHPTSLAGAEWAVTFGHRGGRGPAVAVDLAGRSNNRRLAAEAMSRNSCPPSWTN